MAGSAARMRRFGVGVAAALATALAVGQDASPRNSNLDAPLLYQLLIGEIELQAGQAGTAYEVILDAARRTSDPALYQRAVDIALQARAGDKALAAARAWRTALPAAVDAMRYETQILLALGRNTDAMAPLSAWLKAIPQIERPAMIASLPRVLVRAADRKQVAPLLEQVLAPYLGEPATRTPARVAIGRVWLAASEPGKALVLARQAHADEPQATGPALLALELMGPEPQAEDLLRDYLGRPDAELQVRLAYTRTLAQRQRFNDAVTQLQQVTKERPELAPPWLTLGALLLDMRQFDPAEAAIRRYISLVEAGGGAADTPHAALDDGADAPDLTQARLLMAQLSELRGDLAGAERWLAQVDSPQRALDVQSRRASVMARQGRIDQARALIRSLPERNDDEARSKLMAEAQVLRDVKRWKEAAAVLADGNKRFADDADMLYEQAMIEERLDRPAELERLLRRVIELKPEHAHAHNALGYSLADRNQRLSEARALIQRALELLPGDPFITDSLGWVEFRMGNRSEAMRLLRQAFAARPDTEIAAHLGEVLWVSGQRDEARRIWAEARQRDAGNEVLKETLARLKVGL